MAQRDENYPFIRRIADRGSDKIVFDSQDRKIQETDPKDVIWDEVIGKEEHPEDDDGYKFQETDSEAFIRDENFGKEEYLENCSTLYLAPPRFDEYEDDAWYSWMTSYWTIGHVHKEAWRNDSYLYVSKVRRNDLEQIMSKYLIKMLAKEEDVHRLRSRRWVGFLDGGPYKSVTSRFMDGYGLILDESSIIFFIYLLPRLMIPSLHGLRKTRNMFMNLEDTVLHGNASSMIKSKHIFVMIPDYRSLQDESDASHYPSKQQSRSESGEAIQEVKHFSGSLRVDIQFGCVANFPFDPGGNYDA